MTKKYRAIGLMSGTSLDAIDVALLETDGQSHVNSLGGEAFAYDATFRQQVRQCFGNKAGREDPQVAWVEEEITKRHALAVKTFMAHAKLEPGDVDLIGFHGQTIHHDPKNKITIQLGNGALLAQMTGVDVVYDFRTADVQAGGQGAPLVPLYHRALASGLPKPLAIVNIGGVANVTLIAGERDEDILAFDCGPGNALLDDWMLEKTGKPFDAGGALAATGRIDNAHMELFLHHPFFEKAAPKSLDRDAFSNFTPSGLSEADGAATLTMMTAQGIVEGLSLAKARPATIYLCGGGRHNATLAHWIAERAQTQVRNVDELGWSGDHMEAEAFAYLAVRSSLGLPLTLPTTTGVATAITGGRLVRA